LEIVSPTCFSNTGEEAVSRSQVVQFGEKFCGTQGLMIVFGWQRHQDETGMEYGRSRSRLGPTPDSTRHLTTNGTRSNEQEHMGHHRMVRPRDAALGEYARSRINEKRDHQNPSGEKTTTVPDESTVKAACSDNREKRDGMALEQRPSQFSKGIQNVIVQTVLVP
jgi:hypothetical protein